MQISGNDSNKSKLTDEEIKNKLNSGNACYRSAQDFPPPPFKFYETEIRTYRTVILLAVLYGRKKFVPRLKGRTETLSV